MVRLGQRDRFIVTDFNDNEMRKDGLIIPADKYP